MALEISRLPKPDAVPGQTVSAVERLWLTESRDRVVPDGHPDAAFLFCSPGDEIPVSTAAAVGLVEGADPEPAEAESEEEAAAEPETAAEATGGDGETAAKTSRRAKKSG